MNDLSGFTNIFQLSKTLRFELIPIGDTQKHIEENGILENDERRAEQYKQMKKIIDEYHKAFINRAMTGIKLTGLKEFYRLYSERKRR